jgi:hydroxymethylbilane synthase
VTSSLRHTPPLTAAEQQCVPGAEHRPAHRVLRLGTRGSALASTQSTWVAERLREAGHDVELVEVRTEGDVNLAPLTQIGGTGVFASALRTALRSGEVDLAVHSLKDLPVAPEPGLSVVGLPQREDPRDAVVTRGGRRLAELPAGALVGTGSPRRAAQVQLLAPQVRVVDIRGNVGTRIAKVHSGEVDAVVLAAAGLRRLGRIDEAAELLDLEHMLPAPGQGALAVECRTDDAEVLAACAGLDDPDTRACVTAERSLLQRLEAGCTAPIGAHAHPGPTGLVLTAFVAQRGRSLRHARTGSDPDALGRALAEDLLDRIAADEPSGASPSAPTTERDS